MENVTKRFGKVVANNAINLELHEGEILSLLGENGSGKTTLMNMLSGIYFPDEGQIYIHGEPVTIASPKDAFEHGIGMIHQHFKLVDLFTATENIILGLEGKLDIAEASKKVKEICDKYGFDIDPNQKIYDMSVSQKQTVEIVKVLYRGADILILDEPTAVLTPQETDKLFAIMRNMKADGKSLIIITHKLHEVLDVSDRVAVLRKGEYVGDVATKDADQQSLTDMMVGHTVSLNINRPEPKNVAQRLVIDGLTAYDELVRFLRCEHGGGLIKDEDIRPAVEDFDDLDRLLLRNGHIVNFLIRVDVKAVLVADVLDFLARLGDIELTFEAENDVLRRGEEIDELEVLVDHADAVFERILGGGDRYRFAMNVDLPLIGEVDTGEHIHQRGLAAAVFAQQR